MMRLSSPDFEFVDTEDANLPAATQESGISCECTDHPEKKQFQIEVSLDPSSLYKMMFEDPSFMKEYREGSGFSGT
jgi:hypothetical protein